MKISIAIAGSISSSVRSCDALGAARDAGLSVATALVMAFSLRLVPQDQTVRNPPAQRHRRTDGQRGDPGGVLQIHCNWRSAINLHRVAQDVTEKRAAANHPGKRVAAGIGRP